MLDNPLGVDLDPGSLRLWIRDWPAVLLNPAAQSRFVHLMGACYLTAAAVVLAVSAWYLLHGRNVRIARRSLTVAAAFGFAAALSVVAVVLLSGIYEPARQSAPQRHPLQEIKEGAAFVLHHPLLRPVFVTQFIFNTASFLLLAVFVPYAVRRLALSATGVGTTLAMYGVGMVFGALLATRVMRRLPFGVVIGLGPVTGFVAATLMALTTLIPSPALAGLSFFLLGAGPILWVISTTTLRQSVTPPSLLGRVSAINIMSYGARPLGSALGAVVGGIYGAESCLYLAAVIFGAQALVILMSPAVSLAQQPEMISEPTVA